jgi:hypothetical protein
MALISGCGLYCGSEILVQRFSSLRRTQRDAWRVAGQSNEDMGMDCATVLPSIVGGRSSANDLRRGLRKKSASAVSTEAPIRVVTLLSAGSGSDRARKTLGRDGVCEANHKRMC